MKRLRGFTLVELMVVVGITAMLAVLATTEYQRMTAKARRAEALGNLEKIHTLQVAYHTENQRYGTFREIGFWVEGRARYDYCYGTGITACIYAQTTGVSGAVTAEKETGGDTVLAFSLFPIFLIPGPTSFVGGNPHVSTGSYEVVARGRISPFASLDAWTMDESHTLTNTVQGY